VGKCRGWSRVGQVIGWHINCLHRCDRTRLC
jgi:hypothetical protein